MKRFLALFGIIALFGLSGSSLVLAQKENGDVKEKDCRDSFIFQRNLGLLVGKTQEEYNKFMNECVKEGESVKKEEDTSEEEQKTPKVFISDGSLLALGPSPFLAFIVSLSLVGVFWDNFTMTRRVHGPGAVKIYKI